jgi:Protein of unknown function (DUF3300)
MRPQTYLHASRTAGVSRLQLDSPLDSSPDTGAARDGAQTLRCLVALAMALLLLPLGQGTLFAQQSPPAEEGWPQNNPNSDPTQYPNRDPNNGQYAPDQPSGSGQQPYAQPPYPASGQLYPQQGYGQAPPPAQPLNAVQLEQLVAPIALYPDTLVAQVLAASTYPAQVVDTDHWRQAQGYVSPDQIAAGADVQTWDPSLKALTAFPQVLAEMDRNLQWTTDLGNAYYNQPQDVLEAVQVMRQRAQAAGNLQSTSQEAVRYDQGNIELAPVNPQMVYVPAYNPWAVYGEPVSPYPGFSLLGALGSFFGSSFGSSPVRFGLGIAMTAFSHASWGWLAWGLSWLTQSVLFHQSNYFSHSTTVADWGFGHGGRRAVSERGEWRQNSYNRTPGSYGRTGGGYNATQGRAFVRPPDRDQDGYTENRSGERFGHGFQPFGGGSARPPLQAYNHIQPPASRRGSVESYGRRPGSAYGSSQQAYRGSATGFQRGEFGERSPGAFGGRDFAGSSGKPAHSGGFHLFGGGHSPKNYSDGKSFSSQGSGGRHSFGGGHAPKSYRAGKSLHSQGSGGRHSFNGGHAPKSYGGGKNFSSSRRSGGGGHSGSHDGGKHHH